MAMREMQTPLIGGKNPMLNAEIEKKTPIQIKNPALATPMLLEQTPIGVKRKASEAMQKNAA